MGFFRERPLIFSLVSGLPQEGGDQDIRALQSVSDKKTKNKKQPPYGVIPHLTSAVKHS